jgi:hypothetical protein
MNLHTPALLDLTRELLNAQQFEKLMAIVGRDSLDFFELEEFDAGLGWGSFRHVNNGNTGNYHGDDRDVFRPLQYCRMYFEGMAKSEHADWFTREIVHMSSLHLEALVRRIGMKDRLPLGRAIQEKLFRTKVDHATWSRLDRFHHVYNDSKHNVGHPMDTHLFSHADAILAYVVCRRLGIELHGLASLKTAWQ